MQYEHVTELRAMGVDRQSRAGKPYAVFRDCLFRTVGYAHGYGTKRNVVQFDWHELARKFLSLQQRNRRDGLPVVCENCGRLHGYQSQCRDDNRQSLADSST
jgi:hypothetical protein